MLLRTTLSTLLLLLSSSCHGQQQRPNAALIVGGYYAKTPAPDGPTLRTVELFGCAGSGGRPIPMANFPRGGYLMGGMRVTDTPDDHVMICGGYHCLGTICGIEPACFTWDPASNVWRNDTVSSLRGSRWSYILAQGPNLNTTARTISPIAVGYNQDTEIYDREANRWSVYRRLPEANWYGLGCLFQDNAGRHEIYNVRNQVTRLDLTDWSVTQLATVPPPFVAPGMCAPVSIGTEHGFLIRYGYFFNFATRQWRKVASPPHNALAILPNALTVFRGRPTVFGNPRCNDVGVCDNTEVVQYIPEEDRWISLGDMSRARTYQAVIEVPASYCDYFVTETTTTTPATTTTTTTATTTATTEGTTTAGGARLLASVGMTLLLAALCL